MSFYICNFLICKFSKLLDQKFASLESNNESSQAIHLKLKHLIGSSSINIVTFNRFLCIIYSGIGNNIEKKPFIHLIDKSFPNQHNSESCCWTLSLITGSLNLSGRLFRIWLITRWQEGIPACSWSASTVTEQRLSHPTFLTMPQAI